MALNPSGAISLGGPSAGQSIALELGLTVTAQISLNQTDVRTLAGVASGQIVMPTDFWGKSAGGPTQKAIFGFGQGATAYTNVTNLVSSTGVMAADTPGVGMVRANLAASNYGGDKAIFGFGFFNVPAGTYLNVTNLVSNTGIVASDTPGVGTARAALAAAKYSNDKAIFGFGNSPPAVTNITNLVSNTGVVASNTPGVGTSRQFLAAAAYGNDKAIFGFGLTPTRVNITNLVSNTGVVASDSPGVGTARGELAAAGYGGDKAIFGFGSVPPTLFSRITNLVSNTGVVASDTANSTQQVRRSTSASSYGGDKAIFGYGDTPLASPGRIAITTLVSNTGVLASDTPGAPGVSTRENAGAAGYSFT